MDELNKFSMGEIILGGFFLFAIDVVCAFLDFLGIGLVIAPILQAGGSFATTLWLRAKGDQDAIGLARQITKYAANILPILPTLTTAFIIETYIHNHPKLTAVTGSAGGKIPGVGSIAGKVLK